MAIKVLIADKLSSIGLDWLKQQPDVEFDVKPGLPAPELAKIVGDYDGMIIRSGVKVTAEVLVNPGRLKGIARAGVGVDNVDVPVATSKGIIVMNTPGGNTISTAELTLALILGLSRKIAAANASMRAGQWDRKSFEGTQLAGKTLGIIGLGRIGRALANRAIAMEMRVIGFDPYLAESGGDGPIEVTRNLDELLTKADYITVHVPKSAETSGMIGAAQIAKMKPTVRLINAARGGIIDPQALLEALEEGRIAGAALDVYTSEPPKTEAEQKLIAHPKVLAVPHLGASTEEAQEQVALEAAEQLVEALRGGAVRNAVNAPGFGTALPAGLWPYTELASRMGSILAGITPGAIKKVEVTYRGQIADDPVQPITTHLLVGLLRPFMDEPVNVINAPVLAQQRGIEVRQSTTSNIKNFVNMMEVTATTDKRTRTIRGTIFGNRYPRIIDIDGFRMELKPEGHVVIIVNDDKPGVVGRYGTIFGSNKINIADMTFSRSETPEGVIAVVGINLDQVPPKSVMEEIRKIDFVHDAWALELPPLPSDER